MTNKMQDLGSVLVNEIAIGGEIYQRQRDVKAEVSRIEGEIKYIKEKAND